MKRSASILIAILASLASLTIAQTQPTSRPNAVVTLKKLVEKRELSMTKDDSFAGWENGIELSLHVDGPDVQGARKYGKLKAIQALDDAGTDLLAKGEGPSFGGDTFREVREAQGFSRPDQPKPSGFDVDLKLPTPSARNAKSIKVIAGMLEVLVGGEKKIVQVKQLKSNMGKAVDDPALKALGVTFTLIDPNNRSMKAKLGGAILGGGNPNKSVSAEITGNIDALADVRIVDAKGEKLSRSSMWSDDPLPAGGGRKRSITYDLENPLPDDAILELEVWPGQKTVTVLFEFRDLKLP
jgi:hypothetical protein